MLQKHRSKLNFIFGSLAGMIATTLLYPTLMIKRVFQANSKYKIKNKLLDDKNLRISSWIVDCYRKIGITHFYKGMSIYYIKTIPYQGILFWTNEKLKIILGNEINSKH
jgi:solute carrier family 25 protein 16